MLKTTIRLFLFLCVLFLPSSTIACNFISDEYSLKLNNSEKEIIKNVISLYSDGFAKPFREYFQSKEVQRLKSGYSLTVTSFTMENFSKGNNHYQFIVILEMKGKECQAHPNHSYVVGIIPLPSQTESFDLNTAEYQDNIITIYSFSKKKYIKLEAKGSIFWSLSKTGNVM